jgi:S-DNA-T family DNA segregation ATPase FtsK/SpoIIIE
MNLIGEMAGVLGGSLPPPPEIPPKPAAWPKSPNQTEEDLGCRMIRALIEFKADARGSGEPVVGPAFVRFFVQPEHGVSTSKVLRQGANLQVRLGVKSEPVIHMVEGRIAIDVARPNREVILFRHLEERIPRGEGGSSKALVGIDLSNNMLFLDFAAPEHAHVLVAGVAGGGKSEWLRTALASLVLANTPETLRLVLIDPKRNAFLDLEQSPFLLRPGTLVHPPQDDVMPVLEELIEEMERRSQLFKDARADNLADYRRKSQASLPRIVVACDEFADLVMASKQQRAAIELVLNRLGQKARAAGIHLVIATQSPRREVVSGILRANTPARVALRVTTAVESRLILDRGGAEKLLGRGDLLFASNHEPIRLQAPYLTDEDRLAIFGRPATRTAARP